MWLEHIARFAARPEGKVVYTPSFCACLQWDQAFQDIRWVEG